MISGEFKKGDRVIVNHLNPPFQGRIGTVAYTSGDHYWVEFDDSDTVEPGFYAWWLEPTVLTEAELEAVATG